MKQYTSVQSLNQKIITYHTYTKPYFGTKQQQKCNSFFRYLLLVLLCTFCALASPNSSIQAQGSLNSVLDGSSKKRKKKKVKMPKIKYQYHAGKAVLKTGLQLEGMFKFEPAKGSRVPNFCFIEKGSEAKKKISLSMVDYMILAGAEKGITARPDSTEFQWIDKYRDLYRKVRGGTIELFDNSRIVDEYYDFLPNYLLVAGRQDYGYKLVRNLPDIALFMTDRPYFMQAARATERYESADPRVILFLVDLFNDPDPMRVLKWSETIIVLKDGKRLKGRAYVQPLDMRNEYLQNGNAYIHFHDGDDFYLFTHREIERLTLDGKEYTAGIYSVVSKYFFGEKWTYKGKDYVVATRIANNNNFFFKSRTPTQSLVVLKSVADNYVKPANELELRQQFISTLK